MLPTALVSAKRSLLLLLTLLSLSAFAGTKEEDQLTYRIPNRTLNSTDSASFLSGAASGEALDIAIAYLRANKEALGVTSRDLDEAVVRDHYSSRHTGTTHIYLDQYVGGIQVYNATININIAADGSVINVGSSFLKAAWQMVSGSVSQTAIGAANLASERLGYEVKTPFTAISELGGPNRVSELSNGGFASQNVTARLYYKAISANVIRPMWMVDIKEVGAQHFWHMGIDAEDNRSLVKEDTVIADRVDSHGDLSRNALLQSATAKNKRGATDQYEVLEMPKEYPYDGPRTVVVDPAHPDGSPFGWHDTDGVPGPEFTITRGNNTHSFLDRDNNDLPDPGADVDGGPTLDFTGGLVPFDLAMEPSTYSNAAVVNLFYWVNTVHDVLNTYGFDAPGGNFQVNNYGLGGAGNDDVIAYAQKGASAGQFNNAFFGTPSDGNRPEMLMLEWNNTNPNRDGDFSSAIMAHEFGHGVSNRLTGGPGNVGCLNNAEQMGEGWSDFYGLVLTAKASDTDVLPRGIGVYALGQPEAGPGIRDRRYTTDISINEFTYADLPGQGGAHAVGFLWCTIIWEVYWALTNEHGFNPDFYADWSTGGNNLAIQLVTDGMKLQPCGPGMEDGRDAILAADMALTGGANQCLMWTAFAKRGLGANASQGSATSTTDGTADFTVPVSCDTFGVAINSANICAGSDAVYSVEVGSAWTGAVTFSASGQPGASSVTFSPNPLPSVPGTVTMTVSNTGSLPFASSNITISGTDGSTTETADVTLNVFDSTPATPGLVSPSNGAIDVSSTPSLNWTVGPQNQQSTVDVASDPGFSNIVFTTMVGGTSTTSTRLDSLSTYYWRVRSSNPCGDSSHSSVFSFTTLEQPDYFTEEFTGGFDLSNRSTYFTPDSSGDFYFSCSEEVMGFPTDPAGGTPLTLGDDDSQEVVLANPVSLYGVSYNSVYVGSNGYLTFTGPDTDYDETLIEHFNQPRVSALYNDFSPNQSGAISYLDLSDRFVVTYVDLTEYNAGNINTFQVELFHNGDITITHLQMDATEGITGLSAGTGIPGDFLNSELSGGSCVVIVPCPADLNGDMVVDAADLTLITTGWSSPNPNHDLNGDGLNNILDILLIEDFYGTCPTR